MNYMQAFAVCQAPTTGDGVEIFFRNNVNLKSINTVDFLH